MRATSLLALAGLLLAAALAGPAAPAHGAATWKSGARNTGTTSATTFASWRGTPLGAVPGWINWRDGWAGMYTYASGSGVRSLRAKSSNVSLGHGLFPAGGSLAACASGSYNDEHRTVASRLAANGVGDAEIRLGWEASGDWFPWKAAGVAPETWKRCFVNAARAMKSAAPNLRIGWFMAKKGRVDVRTLYPDGDAGLITNIGISHYDDDYSRHGYETYKGGPWGLRAWLDFARSKGKKFAVGEWGVGRRGDRPEYIRQMHDFFKSAGASLAHEGYWNTSWGQLYPVKSLPRSSALYRELF